jgi:hypothetical protein
MVVAPLRHWTALLPLAMSVAALSLVLGHVASGGVREADEGTTAHLWQILMAAQVPLVALFAVLWLPRSPRAAMLVLGLLVAVVLANLAALSYFNL